eukprot:1160902-Pelagomonas_calceolata.AAC.3
MAQTMPPINASLGKNLPGCAHKQPFSFVQSSSAHHKPTVVIGSGIHTQQNNRNLESNAQGMSIGSHWKL